MENTLFTPHHQSPYTADILKANCTLKTVSAFIDKSENLKCDPTLITKATLHNNVLSLITTSNSDNEVCIPKDITKSYFRRDRLWKTLMARDKDIRIDTPTILTQKAHPVNTQIEGNTLILSKAVMEDAKLQHPLTSSNTFTLPAEINGHRKVILTNAYIQFKTKDKLNKLCDEYTNIVSTHYTDIGKTDLVQMTLLPRGNIKPLRQKPYMLPSKTMLG